MRSVPVRLTRLRTLLAVTVLLGGGLMSAAPSSAALPGPSVTAHAASAIEASSTTVTLSWKEIADPDGSSYESYAVRYRASVPGKPDAAWTIVDVPAAPGTVSHTLTLPTSRQACWQVRGVAVGGQTDWSALGCLYLDGQAPRVTRTALQTWMPSKRERRNGTTWLWWTPTFSYAGVDDRGIEAWQVQRKLAPSAYDGGPASRMGEPYLLDNGAWRSQASVIAYVEPGGADCYRARARDAAGLVSAWSAWRCTHGPVEAYEWLNRVSTVGAPARANWSAVVLSTGNRLTRRARSNGKYCATGVRLQVRKGPTAGRVRVFIGGRAVGRFDGRAKKVGWRWVTLRGSAASCGRIRMTALTHATSYVRRGYVLR